MRAHAGFALGFITHDHGREFNLAGSALSHWTATRTRRTGLRRFGGSGAANSEQSSRSISSMRGSTSPRSTPPVLRPRKALRSSSSSWVGAPVGSGKSVLTVLDFIGQAHADYLVRHPVPARWLAGRASQVEDARSRLPADAARLCDQLRDCDEIITRESWSSIRNTQPGTVDDLRGLPSSTTLGQFLAASSFELQDKQRFPVDESASRPR